MEDLLFFSCEPHRNNAGSSSPPNQTAAETETETETATEMATGGDGHGVELNEANTRGEDRMDRLISRL